MRAALARMMPLTSDEGKLTQETKKGNSGTVVGKLQPIEVRPTEVEGREGGEVIVEDARVKAAMGSPKVDAVSGDGAAAKGTPDKTSSSSSSKGGMDSSGSPAAPAIKSGSGSTRGGEGEPEGSPGEPGPPAESSSSAAPSIASHGGGSGPHWDKDILHLLDDLDGVQLFKEYLEQEQLGHYLQFYFFCNGFRELTVDSPAKMRKIIKMAYRDYVAGAPTSKQSKHIECLDEDVRNTIAIVARNPGDNPDMNMFDAAQQQVLDFMRRTSYIKFFESEIYIDYMQSLQTRDSSSSKPHSSASSVSGRHVGAAESAIDQIAATGGSPRLHQRTLSHGASPPTVAEASKSGAGGQPLPYDLVTVDEEKELSLPLASSATSTAKAALPASSTRSADAHAGTSGAAATLTASAVRQMQSQPQPRLSQATLSRLNQVGLGDLHPAAVGGGGGGQRLLSSTAGAAAPYHAMSSTFNPTSRNDSEIQSQSSGAHDTTDNCSSFTEQSGSTFSANQAAMHRQAQASAQMRRRQQKSEKMIEQQEMMRQAKTNHRDPAAPVGFNPNRAGQGPSRNHELATKEPAQFFERLKTKLLKYQSDQETSAKLRQRGVAAPTMSTSSRVKRHEASSYSQHQLSQNYDQESDQSILDDHCSKVFDHTPVRGRSPPTERSKKVRAHKGSYPTWAPSGRSKGQHMYGMHGERLILELYIATASFTCISISAPNTTTTSLFHLGPTSYGGQAGDLANFQGAPTNVSMGNLHQSGMQSAASRSFSDFTSRSSTGGAISKGWAQPQPPMQMHSQQYNQVCFMFQCCYNCWLLCQIND